MTNPLKEANDAGIVKGLAQFGVVVREDVDVLLSKSPDTFNLFLIALKELQEDEFTSWSYKMSFFQLAGIHGLPHGSWDNVGGKKAMSADGNQSGYCAHGTQSFPTWHRPYLAALEQAIYAKILDIVERYDKVSDGRKAAYKDAAQKFRLPYWDYHRPRDYDATFPGVTRADGTTTYPYDFRVPQILTVRTVKVKNYPADEEIEIRNPLSGFQFPKGTKYFSPTDWSVIKGVGFSLPKTPDTTPFETTRWPKPPPKVTSLDALNAVMNEQREGSVRLSLSFIESGPGAAYNKYLDFSTVGVFDSNNPLKRQERPSGSLEAVHGSYHVYSGGFNTKSDDSFAYSGHMSEVLTAAFDPLFWLHHCQIDRWFAIWQATHPNSWFAIWQATHPNSWFASLDDPDLIKAQQKRWISKEVVTEESALLPFRVAPDTPQKDNFWTSKQSADTKTFGYTYNDIYGLENDPERVGSEFKAKYEWARRLVPGEKPKAPKKEMEPLLLDDSPVFRGIKDYKPLNKPKILASAPAFIQRVANSTAPLQTTTFSLAAEERPEVFAITAEPVEIQAPISTAPEVQIAEETVSREWWIDDVIQRLALNGTFSILYLVGEFDKTAPIGDLMLSTAFVGVNHIFTAPTTSCDNCGRQDEQAHLITSTTPITSKLIDYVNTGLLQSMRPEHVKPFLVKNLKWRAIGPDGVQVDPRSLSSDKDFRISVSCKVAPLPGTEGEVVFEAYPEVWDEIKANAD